MSISASELVSPKYSLQIGNTTLETEDLEFLAALRKIDPDCCSALAKLIKDMKEQDWSYKTWTENTLEKTQEKKNKENEMDIMKNFHFGPCGDRAKISPIGIAIKNSNGEWVSYDKEKSEIVNVDLLNFGNSNFVYMIPVAIKDVAEGDAVIHNKHIMFVKKVKEDGITVVDVTDGEYKKILPTKSMFGFNFITKLVSLMNINGMEASEDNPFGNLLPLLLLSGEGGDDNLPLALMMMNGMGGMDTQSEISPWLMMMALNNNSTAQTGSSMSMIPLLMLMMNQK